jgi:hypothetical protein
MDRCLALIVPAWLVTAAILFAPAISVAPRAAEQKECGFCHPKDSWDINALEVLRDHQHSLEGFGRMTGVANRHDRDWGCAGFPAPRS